MAQRPPFLYLGERPVENSRKLRGNLGVASIVFMVVAAAAPLGVIGGVVPLGIASGNGVGFPATFIVATVILLFFSVGFTAMTPHRFPSTMIGLATVEPTPHGFRLKLDEPVYGVAPGQAAVLYDGDLVVGQGTITRAE